jgi:hypothetical protein
VRTLSRTEADGRLVAEYRGARGACLRYLAEAELGDLLGENRTAAAVAATGELVAMAGGGEDLALQLMLSDAALTVSVTAPGTAPAGAPDLARAVLAVTAVGWGVEPAGAATRYWATIDLL